MIHPKNVKKFILERGWKIEHYFSEQEVWKRRRKKWLSKIRKRNRNKDFTLITNNCIGGIIYHDLGLKFNSPTINLTISDFPLFIKHFEEYLECELFEIEDSSECPVGELRGNSVPNLKIIFNHYDSFAQAKAKWNERKQRIDMKNIFFLMESYNHLNPDEFADYLNLPVQANKVVLVHDKVEDMKYRKDIFYIGCEMGTKENPVWAQILEYKENTGKRWLDDFDYVSFLNYRE